MHFGGMCLRCCSVLAILVCVVADWVEVSVIKPDIQNADTKRAPMVWVRRGDTAPTVVQSMPSNIPNNTSPLNVDNMANSNDHVQGEHSSTQHQSVKFWSTVLPTTESVWNDTKQVHEEKPVAITNGVLPEVVPPLLQENTYLSNDQSRIPPSPLMAFQHVHQRLLMEKSATLANKMEFLQQLKNSMLQQIESSMKRMWQNDARQARTAKMGFPSMESALLSLSFLVFAVFLIKLVQQLFQSFGNQNANTATMIVPAQQQVQQPIVGRRRRSVEDVRTTARILQLMDEFQIKFTRSR